jgi:hypothetical protein|tara:strand:- start:608 stop:778 length:171 start_codon:yes stop_codon:yes gene_type:complete
MDHEKALIKALKLAITAPESRRQHSLDLCCELAAMCTPDEVTSAKLEAINQLADTE